MLHTVAKQLRIVDLKCLSLYEDKQLRWTHMREIRDHYGYREFVNPLVGFRLARSISAWATLGAIAPTTLEAT